jgi:hypothetical protein
MSALAIWHSSRDLEKATPSVERDEVRIRPGINISALVVDHDNEEKYSITAKHLRKDTAQNFSPTVTPQQHMRSIASATDRQSAAECSSSTEKSLRFKFAD